MYGGTAIKALETIKNPIEKAVCSTIFKPIKKYYKYRWEHKLFKHAPFLKLIRLVRKIKIDRVIKQ
jgi:hypothetical protein